jgi:threonine dehydrogenase-like Zn-dependent dehydrogenase
MASHTLPETHRALVLNAIGEPLRLETRPTPQPTPGSAVVKILAAGVLSYSRDIYSGVRKYGLPTPSVPGNGAIGRVAAVGADATRLKPRDLVLCDVYLRGRDDHSVGALSGIHEGHTDGSKRLMRGEWRDGTYAEYAKLPLENCFLLNERRLLGSPADGGFGYTVEELLYLAISLVPFGGLRDIGLDVCDKVVISPATGAFGSAAVHVALAMGANVIAMGRNVDALKKLKATLSPTEDRIQTVQITNDVQQEVEAIGKFGPVDAFFDTSPPMAANSTHIKSAILSLKHSGRVSLMGGIKGDIAIPLSTLTHQNLTIKGKWMYERDDILKLIKMVETGVLKLGEKSGCQIVGKFPLEKWQEAFDAAAEHSGPGERVAIVP